ncbi:hypothetical protein [Snodgrassella gandavensis]|uniref:hypothetical protein n=1 Tax=Snodgrassella gandavensis TaxID=2946698 RepID=UPI001EF6FA2E|nr:hypothetical protein [Snodgrassella gandavensis]
MMLPVCILLRFNPKVWWLASIDGLHDYLISLDAVSSLLGLMLFADESVPVVIQSYARFNLKNSSVVGIRLFMASILKLKSETKYDGLDAMVLFLLFNCLWLGDN